MSERVVCFTTGGTIASAFDPTSRGLRSSVVGKDLIRSVPGIEQIANVQVVELANASSTFHKPEQVFAWTRKVAECLKNPAVAGAVVAHGTDTLEESAYLFDLVLQESKPVVFTGAMRPPGELIADGARNLSSAVRVAAHPDARDLGVLVVLNDEVHAARDATKTHADGLAAFASPNLGPLGGIVRRQGRDQLTISRRPMRREHIPTESIETRVGYVKCVMGMDSEPIDAVRLSGARGIVLEAFGGGELTPYMADGVERARAARMELVVATRALRGRPLDLYSDVGEGRWLRDRGVHFAGDITGPKARIKLMLALASNGGADVGKFFD